MRGAASAKVLRFSVPGQLEKGREASVVRRE